MNTLIDAYGRVANKLRISVTDRCNMKCRYCMPSQVQWMPRHKILTFEEILRLIRIFVGLGIKALRFTGGEPLVRHGIVELIECLKYIPGIQSIGITTNGYFLKKFVRPLIYAGVQHINISLDTLDKSIFMALTGIDALEEVLKGITLARDSGARSVKINCVVMKGWNDHEILPMVEWGSQEGILVRFIEFMPLDGDHQWKTDDVITEKRILEIIENKYSVESVKKEIASPERLYRIRELDSVFGIISSVSHPFCLNCNRIRLTADGYLRNCLFAINETDLKTPMRNGCSDETLVSLIRETVAKKEKGHKIGQDEFQSPLRAMNAIGG